MSFGSFFESHRDRMVRHGDWTRAAELNLLEPSQWRRPFRVLVTRLSSYEDTSLSITHHYLYALIAALGYYPDRAFLPPARDVDLWKEASVPWLVGVQSHRPGSDFGLIAVSNAVTQELGNLLWFLINSDFPVAARDRRAREDLPLVLLGGANAPFSSLLWDEDSPVDGIFLGEDRTSIEALLATVAEGRAAGQDKSTILERLSAVPGFLVPGQSSVVRPRPTRLSLAPELLASMPVALGEGNAGKAVLSISGGCAGFCSFCAESWTRKPYVETAGDELTTAALAVKAGQGASRLDVWSFNFNMHADLYPLLEATAPWFAGLGLKSQRIDSLAADPLLIDLEKLWGKTWFTCGVEGISNRLRRALNKNLDSQQLLASLAAFARSGVREVKAFLIATGWEEETDFAEFADLLARLKALPGARPLKVVFSVTPLVRFPHTPLEFEPPPNPKEMDRCARRMLRTAREAGFDGRMAVTADEAAVSDLMVRCPDPAVAAAWKLTVLVDGFVYRDEMPTWFLRHWKDRMAEAGWSEQRLAQAYGPEANRKAPWARLHMGVARGFLEAQFRRNKSFAELKPAALVRQNRADRALVRRWTDEWRAREASEVTVELDVSLDERAADAGRDQTVAALARALMLTDPVLARGYRGGSGGWWSDRWAGHCPVAGDDRFRLRFLPEAAALLAEWPPDDPRWTAASGRFAPFGSVRRSAGGRFVPWVEVTSRAPLDGQRLLARGLKHTLRRSGPNLWSFELAPQALKKDWISWLESEDRGSHWIHRLVPGSKWDGRVFLEAVTPVDLGRAVLSVISHAGPLPLRST